jgi:hypothetical protein
MTWAQNPNKPQEKKLPVPTENQKPRQPDQKGNDPSTVTEDDLNECTPA